MHIVLKRADKTKNLSLENPNMTTSVRHLVLVLGDQLNLDASAFDGFDASQDAVWMAEVDEESTHVTSAKQRIAVFLSAMRHFAMALRDKGFSVFYTAIDQVDNLGTLSQELDQSVQRLQPTQLILTAPGDWRVLQALRAVARARSVPLEIRDDRYFFSTVRDFSKHAKQRKQLRLEFFYRELRQKTGILMDGKNPIGGQWNFDALNRASFGKQGPGLLPPPTRFAPDAITQEVIALVQQRFAQHPGTIDHFGWPVTRAQAQQALNDFIAHRLPSFGLYQDAMWQGEVWLYHSHLSCALNLKLLSPQEVVQASVAALHQGRAPIEAVEGFVRQILGWREYVRGIYWLHMPDYAQMNAGNAQAKLPSFYWNGQTDMACLKDAIEQTLAHGYAHHIQRLMVTGLYALLLGVKPQAVHAWYLGVYVDAVEWVELPNTLGMSQFADAGLMSSKPYIASGKYIERMSNYCKSCRFNPGQSTGDDACPFTTLYWDYLNQHAKALASNPRMLLQLKNLQKLSPQDIQAISEQAQKHRASVQTQ